MEYLSPQSSSTKSSSNVSSPSMLTKEQLARIEENKQKAIKRRKTNEEAMSKGLVLTVTEKTVVEWCVKDMSTGAIVEPSVMEGIVTLPILSHNSVIHNSPICLTPSQKFMMVNNIEETIKVQQTADVVNRLAATTQILSLAIKDVVTTSMTSATAGIMVDANHSRHESENSCVTGSASSTNAGQGVWNPSSVHGSTDLTEEQKIRIQMQREIAQEIRKSQQSLQLRMPEESFIIPNPPVNELSWSNSKRDNNKNSSPVATISSTTEEHFLTDEQKLRIQRNRDAAIRKRKSLGNSSDSSIHSNLPVIHKSPQPSNANPTTITRNEGIQSTSSKVKGIHHEIKEIQQLPTTVVSHSTSIGRPSPVHGYASLITREEFKVDMPYNKDATAVFRAAPGSRYDSRTNTWSFPLTQHEKLANCLQRLDPTVTLDQIPAYVLKHFRNIPQAMLSPEPDIGGIHRVLLVGLMPFQKEAVIFGIKKHGRVLLADESGLGKKIQALGIANYYMNDWPLLIVTQYSQRFKWRMSIEEWLPSIKSQSIAMVEQSIHCDQEIYDAGAEKNADDDDNQQESLNIDQDCFDNFLSSNKKIMIISFDLLATMSQKILEIGFKVVIMGQSEHIKDSRSGCGKVALQLLNNARRAILLNSTPIFSQPIDLFTQINAVNPKLFTKTQYVSRYCGSLKNWWNTDYSGSSHMIELSIVLKETIMVKRIASQIAHEMPLVLRKLVTLDATKIDLGTQSFDKSLQSFRNVLHSPSFENNMKLEILFKLYEETAKVKVSVVRSYIGELLQGTNKFIICAYHDCMLDGISMEMDTAKIPYIRIDGSTTPEDEKYCMHQFQSRPDIRVAILSLRHVNSNLILTAAKLVVFAELFWDTEKLVEAENRAFYHSRGCYIIVEHLMARGTLDDVIWAIMRAELNVMNKAGLKWLDFKDAKALKTLVGGELIVLPGMIGTPPSATIE